jgi:hypothetical protein
VTLPLPLPPFVTVSASCWSVNVAVTVIAAFIVTVQVPVPVQPPPDQPVNVEPVDAAAVSVTIWFAMYDSLQSAPQLMPVAVTVPAPLPPLVTNRVRLSSAKFALIAVGPVTVTMQPAVPVQAPPQPANTDRFAGVCVSEIIVP